MGWIILALTFGLVGSQKLQYEPVFNIKNTYLYQYSGVVLTGLPENGLAKGGLKITSKVQITSIDHKKHLLKVSSPQIYEYIGIWPDEDFIPSPKLTRKLSPQLSQPVIFEYNRGRVGNIIAHSNIPENILNILRGILNILQISIKRNQNIYDLQENGLEGVCHASYTIQEDKKARHIIVTKSKDLNDCQEKISETKSSAYFKQCKTCQMKGKNLRSVSTYTYILKSTDEGAEISEVVSHESHQFTPSNELDGAASTESRQHLYLLNINDKPMPIQRMPTEKRGSLRYQFSNELMQMPMQLVKPSHNETEIANVLEELVKNSQSKAHPDAPQMFLQLIQLLQSADLAGLQSVWGKNANKQNHRQWILDTIPVAATHEAIQFIQTRIEQEELSQLEAAQALVFVLHSIKPDCHGVDNATVLLSSPYMSKNPFLRKITLLSYGSLIHKYCATVQTCPDKGIQPIHDLVVEAGSKGHEEETILGLKTIGNAGQPTSLKRIQKLLPGFSNSAQSISNRIQLEAVMALRNIGKKEPRKVQNIVMQLFMNKKNRNEMRIRAFIVLLETKPSLALVATVTDLVVRETNLQLTSFIYSYMRSLTGTLVPELQSLAAICNIAMKRLNRKCDTLSYRYSKGIHFGLFRDRFLAGIDTNLYLIKKSEGILPSTAIANIKLYGLGVSTDLLEVGIQAEGIQQALSKSNEGYWRGPRKNSTEHIVEKVSDWKPMPTIKPLLNVYIKALGQELVYVEFNQNDIPEVLKIMSNQAKMDGLIRKFMNHLQRGTSIKWTKSLLASEVRQMVPTSLGLPLELAFYYTIVSAVKGQAKVKTNPALSNLTLPHILNSTIQIESQLAASSVKDVIGIMGINSPMIQAGVEVQLKTSTLIPLNFTVRLNYKKRNVKLETPPWQRESQLFFASTQGFAFSRNIEELAAEKVTPLLPGEESGVRMKALRLAKNSTTDHKEVMDRVLPLSIPGGSVCSAEEPPDDSSWTIQQRCMSADTFGFEVCFKTSVEKTDFTTNSPLYKMVGEKSVEIAIKPVVTPIPVKKLQIELQMQTDDQSFTRGNLLIKTSNWTDTDSSETVQEEGKPVLLTLKKILHAKKQNQGRREHKYTMSSSTSSSQMSSRESMRRSEEKGEQSGTRGMHSLTSESNEYKHGDHGKHGKHQLEERIWHDSHSTSSRRSMRRSEESDKERSRTHSMHSSVDREPKHSKDGKHQVLHQQGGRNKAGRRVASEGERSASAQPELPGSMTHQSLSSSSSRSLSKPHRSSLRDFRSRRVFSSSSSSQSKRRRTSTHSHRADTKKCHSTRCKEKLLNRSAQRSSVRNRSLSSTASLSLSSSVSSSAQTEEEYSDQPKGSASSLSASSESSSSVTSSAESRRRESKDASRRQPSSSVQGDTSTDTSSSHHEMVDMRPATTSQTGTDRMCKNGVCIHTQTKKYSATIHQSKKQKHTWISGSNTPIQRTDRNVFQLQFKPTSINMSQYKERLSSWSSFETSLDTKSGSTSSSSSSSSSSSEQSLFLGDLMVPIFSIFTRAITTDNKEKGYKTETYGANLIDRRLIQVLVDELQEVGSWKACLNAEMPIDHKVTGVLRWGNDCLDYKIAAKAATGYFQHHPAALLKAKWDRIPQSMKEAAQVIADHLANFAFLLGFSERHMKSIPHQLSFIVAATSQRTFDIVVRTYKHVYSRQALLIPAALPFDVSSPSIQPRGLHILTYLSAMFSAASTAECTVTQDMFSPFSENSFKYQMPEGCTHVLAQDCTTELKFIVLITRHAELLTLQLNLPFSEIIVESKMTGNLQLTINGTKMSMASLPFTSSKTLSIERSEKGLKIEAPRLGLESLFFDGKVIKVSTVPWTFGTTCGLCGQGISQGSNEYQQPNRRKTKEVLKFAHSWLLPGENCKDTCKLTKRTVKLNRSVKLHGQDSKCYSTEPVLRCHIGCSPVKTVPVVYGFHCLPTDSNTNPADEQLKSTNFGQKSEDMTSPIDAHVACSCSSECK
ncbi:vitellogenin-like isoform X1 [Pristis pectinata]|uniref:vitellogenin-like isoform X1 n=1 Tax=Pristis pectinata TaxID=685728 RepID=UPI00223DB23D|nr:vitellogenin-like isoform X1 [Pristis pectinata]